MSKIPILGVQNLTPNSLDSTSSIPCFTLSTIFLTAEAYFLPLSPSKATPEVEQRFVKGILGGKRVNEAVQQFSWIARGLEGFNFGWAATATAGE